MSLTFALEYMDEEAKMTVTELGPEGIIKTWKPDYSTIDLPPNIVQISVIFPDETIEKEDVTVFQYQRIGDLQHDDADLPAYEHVHELLVGAKKLYQTILTAYNVEN